MVSLLKRTGAQHLYFARRSSFGAATTFVRIYLKSVCQFLLQHLEKKDGIASGAVASVSFLTTSAVVQEPGLVMHVYSSN